MQKIGFYTLGCKVNQYETEALKELFGNNGFIISDFEDFCDIYVINSCTVTATGDKKSRSAVSKARRKNENAVIALIGCYAQHLTDKEKETIKADIILGNGEKNSLLSLVKSNLKVKDAKDVMEYKEFEDTAISGTASDRARGYIKIQDGCNRYCSYCIIPYVRGKVRSRPLQSIENEAKRLSENGIREIVLTGIQVGAYGDDFDKGISLIDAIEAAAKAEKVERIRLSSIEPVAITEEFLQRVSKIPAFCFHFHLSLQSGCDKILKAMNRRYTTKEYLSKVNLIRKYFPYSAITTDIIAGFPGETEEDFKETLCFAEKCRFSKIHAFPYSKREGTKAALLKDLPARHIRNERAKELIDLSERMSNEFLQDNLGKEQEVYVEKFTDGYCFGYTSNYIYLKIKSDRDLTGETIKVTLTKDLVFTNEEE